MKFIVDLTTNNQFLQIVGLTETNEQFCQPFAFQVRGHGTLAETILDALRAAVARTEEIDRLYHTDSEARAAFDGGETHLYQGGVPVVTLLRMRMITLFVGSHSVTTLTNLKDAAKLIKAFEKAIAKAFEKAIAKAN